jgi:Arc/MetJ family transcription regulator
MLRRFTPPLDSQFTDPLADVAAFARVAVPAKYLYDAEQEGLSLIDDTAAWLTTRLRYSWSQTPDRQLEPYERAATLVVVERVAGVAVFPVEGRGRRWWRDTSTTQHERDMELAPDSRWLAPPMPTQVSAGDRQALLALQRAITARDPVQRVAAFWDAIEFYLGDRSPAPGFTDEKIAAAVERASKGLTAAKSERVGNVLRQWLNSWSPTARLEHVLRDEGVPFSDEDMRRVKRLRGARNRSVHGAEAAPADDEIDQAVGLMSRAISTRWSPAER